MYLILAGCEYKVWCSKVHFISKFGNEYKVDKYFIIIRINLSFITLELRMIKSSFGNILPISMN